MNKRIWLLSFVMLACISCSKKKELVEYYPNGGVKSVWYFESDTLNGVKYLYWDNGILAVQEKYSNGKRNGLCYQYYKRNGWIAQEATFINGLLQGKIYDYFSTDSAKIKYEAYYIIDRDEQFNYYKREFDREGNLIYDTKILEFYRANTFDPLIVKYVGKTNYDSMQVIIGNYDYRFQALDSSSRDTLNFQGALLLIPYQHKLLKNEFLRGRFYGHKGGEEKGDTVFWTTTIEHFEEKLNEIPKVRPIQRKKISPTSKRS